MKYLVTVLAALLAVFIVLLVEFNQDVIAIKLTPSTTKEISKSAFFLLSFAAGAVAVFILYFFRDVKRFLRGLKVQREQKRRSKIQELYTKGLNALLAKRSAEAAVHFQKVLGIEPNHVDTLLRLGINRLREKNPQEAILLHQKALGLDPANQEVMFSLAADYEEAKRYDDALRVYHDIIARDGSNLTAMIRKRDLYQRTSQWEELAEAQALLLTAPLPAAELEIEHRKLAGFKYEHGRSLLESGNLERARRVFRSVIKLDRDFIPAYLGLGEVYLEERKSKEAAELWEKAYKMTSSILLLLRLEDLCLRQGEPGRAIEVYKSAVTWKPTDNTLRFFLGKLYYRLEMIDEAFNTLTAVDWSEREFPDVHKLLGNIYLRRGSLGLAIGEFKKTLGLRKQVIVPYTCSSCSHKTTDWSGRCPNCGKWNTFGIDLDHIC